MWGRKERHRNWRRVCWSDEATFKLGYNGRTWWITRAPSEEWLEKNLKPSFKSGRTAIGVWGCFMDIEMGPLVILPKGARMNQHQYTNKVLKPAFVPFYKKMVRKYGKDVVMQEDRAKYHYTKIPTAFKTKKGVICLKWPAQSPNLSPIENLWK
jgi:hypothetical protein